MTDYWGMMTMMRLNEGIRLRESDWNDFQHAKPI